MQVTAMTAKKKLIKSRLSLILSQNSGAGLGGGGDGVIGGDDELK